MKARLRIQAAVGLIRIGARAIHSKTPRLERGIVIHRRTVQAEQIGGDAIDQQGLARLVLANHGVARDHVRHLVRQHRGKLGCVVGERDRLGVPLLPLRESVGEAVADRLEGGRLGRVQLSGATGSGEFARSALVEGGNDRLPLHD